MEAIAPLQEVIDAMYGDRSIFWRIWKVGTARPAPIFKHIFHATSTANMREICFIIEDRIYPDWRIMALNANLSPALNFDLERPIVSVPVLIQETKIYPEN